MASSGGPFSLRIARYDMIYIYMYTCKYIYICYIILYCIVLCCIVLFESVLIAVTVKKRICLYFGRTLF